MSDKIILIKLLYTLMPYTFDGTAKLETLLKDKEIKTYQPGETIHGTVVGKSRKHILVDLEGGVTGVITGKELNDQMGTAKDLELGQDVLAIVIDSETEEGTLLLSLRKAGQLRAWDKFYKAYENQEVVEVIAHAANKGGLLIDISGIKAFLPVSQLSPENYPRVEGANANRILEKLETLTNRKLKVRVIGIDKEEGKLIFSEREASSSARKKQMEHLSVGQVLQGKVTGVVKFGIFVAFGELEGLVHISEIAWGHVKDPNHYAKIGDEIDVKVIGIDGEKISLSMKQLVEDPWLTAVEKYKVGTIVRGVVNKVSDFGAFITLDKDVNGLIHLSEIDHGVVNDPTQYFKEGEEIDAKVIDIDIKEHRIALSTKALKPEPAKNVEQSTEEK